MQVPSYSLFFDNHTSAACPDVGAAFDADAYVVAFEACGVDFVTFHARCNQGFAYYPTEIGTPHPSLQRDLFGELVLASHQRGIRVSAYFNGGLSHEEGLQHRDWQVVDFRGVAFRTPRNSPYVAPLCINSGYRSHLLSMLEEVAVRYPVSGFFLDCLNPVSCICPVCVQGMKAQGIDWGDESAVLEFSRESIRTFALEAAARLKAINPDYLIYFNGPGFREQLEAATYFEIECLPTNPGWGYGYLPVMARYVRNLGTQPVLNMTGRFYDWGDFGGLRPRAALEYDLFYGLANGMRPNIGCHFHPRGERNNAVFERIQEVYDELRRYDSSFSEVEPGVDLAIYFPRGITEVRVSPSLRGCVQMLEELKAQFEIIASLEKLSRFKLLILPDDQRLDERETALLLDYLNEGGRVLSSGTSGLEVGADRFALEEEWGVRLKAMEVPSPAYFETSLAGFPAMPIALRSGGIAMECRPGTLCSASLVEAYYPSHWDGERPFFYCPPAGPADSCVLSFSEQVAHISHRIFEAYHHIAAQELRYLVRHALDAVLPVPLVKADNLPSFARLFVGRKAKSLVVTLLAYIPQLRGKIEVLEEPSTLTRVTLAVRDEEERFSLAIRMPDAIPLPVVRRGEYLEVTLTECCGIAVVHFQ